MYEIEPNYTRIFAKGILFAFLRSITEGVGDLDLTAGGTAAMVCRAEKGKEFSECGIIIVCGGPIFVDFLGVIDVPMNA